MLGVFEKLIDRSYLVLLSVYIHNEYQGFSQLELLLKAFKEKYPLEIEMQAAIARHAADEKKHYLIFKNFFERTHQLPIRVGAGASYVDQFIKLIFKKPLKQLNQKELLSEDESFYRLCRLIMMTERRGLKQVRWLLNTRWIKRHDWLEKAFRVVEKDEPSHFEPYELWLKRNGKDLPTWKEKSADFLIHHSLVFFRVPLLYFNVFQSKLEKFPYE